MLPLTTQEMLARARQFAPMIAFDHEEPFLPSHIGVSILAHSAKSPSSDHKITFTPDTAYVIEYAIWWDWDIQHLYELEHVWLFVDTQETIVQVEASAHGRFAAQQSEDGTPPKKGDRIILHSEPGKHAFFSDMSLVEQHRERVQASCEERAGSMDILIQPFLEKELGWIKPYHHHLARRFMQSMAFTPSFVFDQHFDLCSCTFMAWTDLKTFIPNRIKTCLDALHSKHDGLKAILLDSGDTLVDEGSEIWKDDIVQTADTIPGAVEMVKQLEAQGHLVALVADGNVESFDNVHDAHDLTRHFKIRAISEEVGVEKPDRRMFDTACERLGLSTSDYSDIVYVGNNLSRDMAGAKALGMKTVWISWSPRRRKEPRNDLEKPDATIKAPMELLDALKTL